MTRTWVVVLAMQLMAVSQLARAESFDWEVDEEPAGQGMTWLRSVRDGFVGLADDVADLQTALFAEVALSGGQVLMAGSDLVGMVDDNPLSQYVFKGVFSKSISRTAYLLHISGSEAVLGSHGLEAEWYMQAEMDELNPLLQGTDTGPRLPQEPMAFMQDSMFHREAVLGRIPGRILVASLAADLFVRPAGNLVRMTTAYAAADAMEARSRSLMRWAVD